MKLEPKRISRLVRNIINSGQRDIGCDACMEELDQFVDLHLAGKHPEDTLPLVKYHLDQCGDCHEEFMILLEILENYPN